MWQAGRTTQARKFEMDAIKLTNQEAHSWLTINVPTEKWALCKDGDH